jgi:hypothetical protein
MMTTRKATHTGNTLTATLAGWFLLTIALAGLAGVVLLEAAGCGIIVNARATPADIDYETVAAVLGGAMLCRSGPADLRTGPGCSGDDAAGACVYLVNRI